MLAPLDQKPERHHLLMIRALQDVAKGQCRRLMLLLPPGSAKSTYASVLFPTWYLARFHQRSIIAASHTAELAERFGRKVRNLASDNRELLNYGISSDNRAAGRWETTNLSEYFAAGVKGSVTGRRSDLGIIDDPVAKRADAESESVREATWAWYQNDFYTRLKPNAAIVLIMTRWHEDDLGGRLLEQAQNGGDQWRIIKLPALCDSADDLLGRAIGEPLWPEWEDAEAIAAKRAVLGERNFGALFQQDPRPAGTSFFDQTNVLLDGAGVPVPQFADMVFAVIDTATKTGAQHDGTAVTYWAHTSRHNEAPRSGPNGLVQNIHKTYPLVCLDYDIVQIEGSLLDVWLQTVFQKLQEFAVITQARMGSAGAFIEDKSSGMVLLQQARRRQWPATAIDSKLTSVGKDERAISVSGYVHGGKVKLSQQAFNNLKNYKGRNGNHLLMQVFRFQIGVKDQEDDLLDSFTYAIAISLGDSKGF